MTESILNQLPSAKLATLALNSATFLAAVTEVSVKLELYYLEGHFIELSYSGKKRPGNAIQWRLFSANHFPDGPTSNKYLAIYLTRIKLHFEG